MPKLGNLAARALVALVVAPILVVVMYLDRPEWTWGVVFVASLIAMNELFSMTLADATDRAASLVCGAAAAAALYWLDMRGGPLVAVVVSVVPIALYYLFRFGDLPSVAGRVAFSVTGIVYAGLMFTFLALLKRDFGPAGGDLCLLVLAVAWVADTGAYFAGRFLGKRKLYPAVSPGKTWAGAFGGLAGSVGAATVLERWRLPALTWYDVAVVGVVCGAIGQTGDLFESMIKRSRGVKDSGNILPGHGGILDRVDAVLFIAPLVYCYLWLRAAGS